MKQMLKLELKKAITNKLFISCIIIGCLITVLSLIYNVNTYYNSLAKSRELGQTQYIYGITNLFNSWIGGEPFSLGTSIYFFIFPLLISIPFGWSYCEEKNNGYIRIMVCKTGKGKYFLAKYIATFISGALAMIIPLIFNILTVMLFIPSTTPDPNFIVDYGVFGGDLLSYFYYTAPFLYLFLYLLLDFVFCGLIACFTLTSSIFIKQKWIVVIIPFFICLAIHFSTQFIYTSDDIIYNQISPLYFLRAVPTGYPASWGVIISMGIVFFIITFLSFMLWEKNNEIY